MGQLIITFETIKRLKNEANPIRWHGQPSKNHFTHIPDGLARDPDIPPGAFRVLVFLRSNADGFRTSLNRMHAKLKMTKDAISKALRVLNEGHWIAIVPTGYQRCIYHLPRAAKFTPAEHAAILAVRESGTADELAPTVDVLECRTVDVPESRTGDVREIRTLRKLSDQTKQETKKNTGAEASSTSQADARKTELRQLIGAIVPSDTAERTRLINYATTAATKHGASDVVVTAAVNELLNSGSNPGTIYDIIEGKTTNSLIAVIDRCLAADTPVVEPLKKFDLWYPDPDPPVGLDFEQTQAWVNQQKTEWLKLEREKAQQAQ